MKNGEDVQNVHLLQTIARQKIANSQKIKQKSSSQKLFRHKILESLFIDFFIIIIYFLIILINFDIFSIS